MYGDGITFFTDVIAVSAGGYHTMAIKNDNTLWAWGGSGNGQLGDGSTNDKNYPVQVMSDVIAVYAGGFHTVAIKNGNTVWAWGDNYYGQLGDGSTIQRSSPVQVMSAPSTPFTNVIAVYAGGFHTVAIDNDGNLWAWGYNSSAQLGDGTYSNRSYPVKVKSGASTFFTNVKAISAGVSHTVAIKEDGSVWAWGRNQYGQLGDGATLEGRAIPKQVLQRE